MDDLIAWLPRIISLAALVFALLAVYNGRVTGRLLALTKAHHDHAAANWALVDALRARTGVEQARANVATTKEAVCAAQARLPRRSKMTRRYKEGTA